MLTSSANQYLRPDYLTPLSTTLDAKKSPLALLAQTCSQIGADPPSTKSLLAPVEKSNKLKSNESREKSSPHNGTTEQAKSSFKPYESCLNRDKASSPEQQQQQQQRAPSSHSTSGRSRTPGSNGKRCSSNQSASSTRALTPQGRKTSTPNSNDQTTRESPVSRTSNSGNTTTTTETTLSQASRGSPQQSKSIYSQSILSMPDTGIKDLPLGGYKPSVTIPSSVASSGYLGYPHQLPIDVMANSIMSQHHAAMKNGLGANPYLSYARVKTSTGSDTLVPVCRDPYCTGCQLNSQLLNSTNVKIPISSASTTTSSCPAGCVQCDHKTSMANQYAQMGAHTMATSAAAYAHAQLAALAAASQLPYVCNWIAGDTAYCGKRFSSSDELLQHLRSHTSVSNDPNAAAAALSMLSPPSLPPTHPLLSRTYPTPPLSPLATARYHPYGKPSPLFPHSLSSLGLGLPSHPHSAAAAAAAAAGLSPYFSPYSLYGGPRLGAASGMHP